MQNYFLTLSIDSNSPFFEVHSKSTGYSYVPMSYLEGDTWRSNLKVSESLIISDDSTDWISPEPSPEEILWTIALCVLSAVRSKALKYCFYSGGD